MTSVQDKAEELLQLLYALGKQDVDTLDVTGATATIDAPDPDVGSTTTVVTLAHATPALTLPFLKAGQRKRVVLVQDGTGSRVPSWVAASTPSAQTLLWNTPNGAAPTLLTAAAAVNVVDFYSYDGTTVVGSGVTAQATVAAFTQTYATADHTVPNQTAVAVTTTGSSNSSPYGYTTSAQADAIPVAINACEADILENRKLINGIINALTAAGLATG